MPDTLSRKPEFKIKEEKPNIPEKLKDFFVQTADGEFANTVYLQSIEQEETGAIIPPLYVGRKTDEIRKSTEPRFCVENIEGYYDEYGFPHTTYLPEAGLQDYRVFFAGNKPIYVFDNHMHSLFAWQEAKEAGLLGEKVALVRMDQHWDMVPMGRTIEDRQNIKKLIRNNSLRIANFIEPAMRDGLVERQYFYSGAPIVDTEVLASGELGKNMTIRDQATAVRDFMAQGRYFDITKDIYDQPDKILELMDKLSAEGFDVIFDIDLDVFERDNRKELMEAAIKAGKKAKVVTCATSPHFEDLDLGVERARTLVAGILK